MTQKHPLLADYISGVAGAVGLSGFSWAVARAGSVLAKGGQGAAFTIMSPSKTLQNAALWPLIADGRLRLEASVGEYLPTFGENGKATVTVEQVMLHTGCFATQPLAFPACADRAVRLQAYAGWTLEGVPGRDYRYHPGNGAWVLADVSEAITGIPYSDLLNQHMLAPLGLFGKDRLALALPVEEQGEVRPVRMALSAEQMDSMPPFRPDPATGESAMLARLNPPAARAIGLPGSGVIGTAPALALLYQAFLTDPASLWSAEVRLDATRRVRLRPMGAWILPLCRTLGFYAAGGPEDRYGEGAFFGSAVSPEAFGHEGQGGQMVWADPATGLSFAFLTDTVTFTPIEQVRWCAAISTRVAELFGE